MLIMVATDFSERSDRALRRAVLLAKKTQAKLVLVHVIDNDQPACIVKAGKDAAAALLSELAHTLKSSDRLECEVRIVEGDPFQGIASAAEATEADILVIGPHRRNALKDVFIGTTAERTIRVINRPVLMANGVPAGSYRRVLVATDLSDCSSDAIRALRSLTLAGKSAISVVHVFDTIGPGIIARNSSGEDDGKNYIREEEKRASRELSNFLSDLEFRPRNRYVRYNDSSTVDVIDKVAREIGSDLLVVGTRGRTGVAKVLLGSVAQEVFRKVTIDILAVPPAA